ncbi:hypothetical protein A9G43_10005 [Gilliamella sp. Occ3-1]|nr:hypothetical protein A9G43_10005 [Gilliamella apicola]
MQLARTHWRSNTKTIAGKLHHQIARAIQLELELELMYSKHDILEAYLNYAPFGRNIESVSAASFIYFNKPPSQVNLPEALTLVVLPQSPTFRVNRKTGFAGKVLVKARNQYLREPNRPLPPNLKRIDICLTSGNLLTQWCKAKGKTWFIPGVSPINPDTIFRPVMVDNQTGKAVCPPYDLTTSLLAVFEY